MPPSGLELPSILFGRPYDGVNPVLTSQPWCRPNYSPEEPSSVLKHTDGEGSFSFIKVPLLLHFPHSNFRIPRHETEQRLRQSQTRQEDSTSQIYILSTDLPGHPQILDFEGRRKVLVGLFVTFARFIAFFSPYTYIPGRTTGLEKGGTQIWSCNQLAEAIETPTSRDSINYQRTRRSG